MEMVTYYKEPITESFLNSKTKLAEETLAQSPKTAKVTLTDPKNHSNHDGVI